MTKSTAVQERVAETILDVAADLLAAGGKQPSMADVAAAAGVSRATLYRYFPTREQLLAALTTAGLNEAATRLAEADLDAVPVPEAIARIARVVAAAGSKYAAVADQADPAGTVEQQIGTMIQAVLRRGIDDQTLRSDLTAGELGYLLGYLLRAAGRMAADHQAGTEKAAALITTVFLHGTQNHQAATPAAAASGYTNP
jgi:TetR/AcrR family transcriptional regulator, mexCD-oprJ operon repressor